MPFLFEGVTAEPESKPLSFYMLEHDRDNYTEVNHTALTAYAYDSGTPNSKGAFDHARHSKDVKGTG